ncbi:unnamed protein product, partial [Pylaiella littoralis]
MMVVIAAAVLASTIPRKIAAYSATIVSTPMVTPRAPDPLVGGTCFMDSLLSRITAVGCSSTFFYHSRVYVKVRVTSEMGSRWRSYVRKEQFFAGQIWRGRWCLAQFIRAGSRVLDFGWLQERGSLSWSSYTE